MTTPARGPLIFLHSSDELYGADRMLLEMVAAVPADMPVEVWLPTDLQHPATPLCVELERRGVAVRHHDLPIMRRDYMTPAGLAKLAARTVGLVQLLRAARPSIVYCATSACLLAGPAARLGRVSMVVGHLQEIWSGRDRQLLGGPARACHRLLAISEAVAQSLPPVLRGRTTVVPNATPDPGVVTPLDGRDGPLRFVIASRWNPGKGHATLLEAWDRAGGPGHLSILGGPPPSGASVDVNTLVREAKNADTVTVVGEVPDASVHIEQADVAMMPSDRPEGFGLVAVEAFARGRPVIGSAAGGLLEIVTSDQDGWLFPPSDVAALTALLCKLDRGTVAAAGRRARQTYEQRFTTDRFAQRWRDAVVTGFRERHRSWHHDE